MKSLPSSGEQRRQPLQSLVLTAIDSHHCCRSPIAAITVHQSLIAAPSPTVIYRKPLPQMDNLFSFSVSLFPQKFFFIPQIFVLSFFFFPFFSYFLFLFFSSKFLPRSICVRVKRVSSSSKTQDESPPVVSFAPPFEAKRYASSPEKIELAE